MDLTALLARAQEKAADVLASLTLDDLYNAWLAGGVVLLVVLGWVSHRIMRRALGHTLFRGTWYDETQFETLVKMIDEDVKRGNRVMKNDEMRLIRKWQYGSGKSISDRAKGYF